MPLKSAAWLLHWIHSHPVCLPTLPGPEYYDDVSYNRHKCFLVVYSAIYQSTSFSPPLQALCAFANYRHPSHTCNRAVYIFYCRSLSRAIIDIVAPSSPKVHFVNRHAHIIILVLADHNSIITPATGYKLGHESRRAELETRSIPVVCSCSHRAHRKRNRSTEQCSAGRSMNMYADSYDETDTITELHITLHPHQR